MMTTALGLLPLLLLIFQLTIDGALPWTAADWLVTYVPLNVCALNGSAAFLNCTYKYPATLTVTKRTWFISTDTDLLIDPTYAGRVQNYSVLGQDRHAIRIADLRKSDERLYLFRFFTNDPAGKFTGNPGVTLNVTVLQVSGLLQVTEGQLANLTCITSCALTDPPTFVWFKDGLGLAATSINSSLILSPAGAADAGGYSCAVKGYEQLRSPAQTLIVRYPPKNVLVTVSPPGDIPEGIIVNLTCTSDGYPAVNYTWFKGTTFLQQGKTYIINTTRTVNSGVYSCNATNTQGSNNSSAVALNVIYPPRNVSVSVSPSGIIMEGVSVTLTCAGVANPQVENYTWFKGNAWVYVGQILTFSSISSQWDGGNYTCMCSNMYGDANSTAVTLNVLYPPRNITVSVSPPGQILEGSVVNLTCTGDANPPIATYTWFKGQTLLNRGQTYGFSSISSTNSGDYKCQGTNVYGVANSTSVNLDVQYPPRNVSLSVSPSGRIVEGTQVNLTCAGDANPPGDNYTWFKGETLVYSGQTYSFSRITSNYSGNYKCQCRNKYGNANSTAVTLNVLYPPRNVLVSVSPPGEIVEGNSVQLTCTGDANPPLQNYTWFKGGMFLAQGQTYSFSNISSMDSGSYGCQCWNTYWDGNSTGVTLDVLYSIRDVAVSISPPGQTFEGAAVNLTCFCDANPPVENYTWFKGEAFFGQGKTYSFSSINSNNSGGYECECSQKFGDRRSSTVTLDILYAPRNILVYVSPPGKVLENSSVNLTCTGDANPPVEIYAWFKGGALLNKGETYSFSSISSMNSGDYKCQCSNKYADRNSTAVTLNVLYPPRNFYVSVSPSSEISETGSVTFTCNSDANPPVDIYTWYRGQSQLATGQTYSISNVTSENKGKYKCTFSNEFGDGSSIATLDVLYAPTNAYVTAINSIILTCNIDANPPVENFTWFVEGNTSPVGSEQVFVASQSGSYYCRYQDVVSASQQVTVEAESSNSNDVLYIVIAILSVCLLFVLIVVYLKKREKKKRDMAKEQPPKPTMTPEEIIFGAAPMAQSTPSPSAEVEESQYASVSFTANGAAYRNAAVDLEDHKVIYSAVK